MGRIMDSIWCSIFLAWPTKATVLKGAALYRKNVPFFLGVALGQIAAAGFWLPVDGFTGTVAIACPFTKLSPNSPKETSPWTSRRFNTPSTACPATT